VRSKYCDCSIGIVEMKSEMSYRGDSMSRFGDGVLLEGRARASLARDRVWS
jgi:hypothetical protein